MKSDWHDYVRLHGNEEGARAAFEHDCEALLKKQFPMQSVGLVRANPGDEGVDVYVGELGIAPVDVYQCKFFLEALGDSQRAQIRRSFASALASKEYTTRSWVLCVPLLDLTMAENKWWVAWKAEQEARYQIPILRWSGKNGHGESNFPLSWKQKSQPANGLEPSMMQPFEPRQSVA